MARTSKRLAALGPLPERRFLRGDYFRGIQFLATAFLVRNLGLCYRRDKPISFAPLLFCTKTGFSGSSLRA